MGRRFFWYAGPHMEVCCFTACGLHGKRGQNRVHCPGYGRVVISGEKQWQESNSGLKYRMTLDFERKKSVRGNDFAAQE